MGHRGYEASDTISLRWRLCPLSTGSKFVAGKGSPCESYERGRVVCCLSVEPWKTSGDG